MGATVNWVEPTLPGMTPDRLVLIRLDVMVDTATGQTAWAITARDGVTLKPLGAVMTPVVPDSHREETEQSYLDVLKLWIEEYSSPF